ncbi:dihydrolipoamide acetyltransferase family protein [Amycolatopsis alkalitolerans]|uniref:Dihydrolipoamide acetyltransferase component of pyruvate dehydrogenase complex n=1 Tax=Amycolatopsis alkalitolerans TaxID=2547244 RepID=A0A5C4LQ73_9PSEU|nr:dihydrolipoamide acetyltransferase family protein [Amycolatopsis alkalitolerans]TNC20474.1 2-oxo acid dehydrogenase subunit E2 [Amycolatopsis alkalitolerans]
MAEFLMPSLGADMDEGTVLEWLVKPGDTVRRGDVVAVVDTAKAAVDVECFVGGTVAELLVPEGEKVPVGTPLARIDTGEPAPARRPLASPPVRTYAAHAGVDLTAVHGTGRGGAITRADVEHAIPHKAAPKPTGPRVTPYARKLAEELAVDLATIDADPVTAEDVRAAAKAPQPAPATRDQSAMRQAIGALMARAKREIPHYYLTTTIDLHAATEWLREHNREVPVADRLVPAALLLKATALAAKRVPQLNGHWVDGAFRPADAVHLGVAIALRGGGLVAPAIENADTLSTGELMARLRDLVSRTRSGRLRSSELTSATITVTSLGDLGVESVHGVIYPPQVALAGFGAVTERPWAVDGMLAVRPVVVATLSGDHRASDGATGARLLNAVDTLLQHPEEL